MSLPAANRQRMEYKSELRRWVEKEPCIGLPRHVLAIDWKKKTTQKQKPEFKGIFKCLSFLKHINAFKYLREVRFQLQRGESQWKLTKKTKLKKAKKSWKNVLCNMVLSSVCRLWSTYSSPGAAHAAPNLIVLWAATEDDSLPLFPSYVSSCSPFLLASCATPEWISSTDPTEHEHGFGATVFFGLTQGKWAGGRWGGRGRSWCAWGAMTSLLCEC